MEAVSILKKGTTLQYSIIDYTKDGKLLGSQGGSPDYTITIWDWQKGEIKLRAKSFSNDVLNFMFSPFIDEQVTTCGLGHIKVNFNGNYGNGWIHSWILWFNMSIENSIYFQYIS